MSLTYKISLFALSLIFTLFTGACSKDNDNIEGSVSINLSNLSGSWEFVRSESIINGISANMDETNFDIGNLPLGSMGIQTYNLIFTKNTLNGFPFSLSGKKIEWSFLSDSQNSGIAIYVASLTQKTLVLHYEYSNTSEGTFSLEGYTDIMYRKNNN